MISIGNLLQQTIHSCYYLKKGSKLWIVKGGTADIKFRSPDDESLGFSLDNEDNKPFPFLSDTPPVHIAKMCDAIIALPYKNEDYIFIIELKKRRRSGSEKQLRNGKYFCEWLIKLLKIHEHYHKNQNIHYIELLVWQPRDNMPNREGTAPHRASKNVNSNKYYRFYKIQNKTDIYLKDYL